MITAVEWLTEKLRIEFGFAFSNNILKQAKEMEKQQIIDAYEKAMETYRGFARIFGKVNPCASVDDRKQQVQKNY